MKEFKTLKEINFIEKTRKASIPPIPLRTVAAKANISHTKWSQVVNGFKVNTNGEKEQLDPVSPDLVARMAYGVNLKPSDLVPFGNKEAVSILEKIYADDSMIYSPEEHTIRNEYKQFLMFIEEKILFNKTLSNKEKKYLVDFIMEYVDFKISNKE